MIHMIQELSGRTLKSRRGSSGIHVFICTSPQHRRLGLTRSSASSGALRRNASDAVSSKASPNSKPPSKNTLDHHNADPKPFIWTASATAILEKVARGRQVLVSVH